MADRGWVSLVWPVPSSKVITQKFGANYNTYAQLGWRIGHSGLDIRTRTSGHPNGIGTPIVAARGGRVSHAGEHLDHNREPSGYGIAVIIDHLDGTKTLYAHNSRVYVRQGQAVNAGQRIADSGMTGRTTGPHLHFELWRPPFNVDGVWGRMDPTLFMEETIFERRFAVRFLNRDRDADDNGDEEGIRVEHGLHDMTCQCQPFIPQE
ncbi:MAG: M23 family metallopeptidase [Ardenticatenaceae bacterium]